MSMQSNELPIAIYSYFCELTFLVAQQLNVQTHNQKIKLIIEIK